MDRAFIDFYEKFNIIPTRLVGIDDEKFYSSRIALYSILNFLPSSLRGKDIAELGPGTGRNASHLLSYMPNSYTAFEGNLKSVEETYLSINEYLDDVKIDVIYTDIKNVNINNQFDFILAESVIPTQNNPIDLLLKLVKMIKSEGFLIFTCMDELSLLSEILRKLIMNKVWGDELELLMKNIDEIEIFFNEDLSYLPFMSRKKSDWIIDQLIHPWIGPCLNMKDAVEAIKDYATVWSSSPKLIQDLSWYKSILNYNEHANLSFLENFEKLHTLFIDMRLDLTVAIDPKLSTNVHKLSKEIYKLTHNSTLAVDSRVKDVGDLLSKLEFLLPDTMSKTKTSLKSFVNWTQNTDDFESLSEFRKMWGRGQQYICVQIR